MLKCEDKRLSWRSLTNIMIQPSTPPRTLVDPLVTFIDVFHTLGRGRYSSRSSAKNIEAKAGRSAYVVPQVRNE